MDEHTVDREAARVILIDAAARTLLFRGSDGHGGYWWFRPGGGLDADPTFSF